MRLDDESAVEGGCMAAGRKLSGRGSPAWCSMPRCCFMLCSHPGWAIIQPTGLDSISHPERSACHRWYGCRAVRVWVSDSWMITLCSLRSDKIKQGRRTGEEEHWGWAPSGKGSHFAIPVRESKWGEKNRQGWVLETFELGVGGIYSLKGKKKGKKCSTCCWPVISHD